MGSFVSFPSGDIEFGDLLYTGKFLKMLTLTELLLNPDLIFWVLLYVSQQEPQADQNKSCPELLINWSINISLAVVTLTAEQVARV